MSIVVGVVGALFIIGAWIFETFESVKNHKTLIDLRFAAVYAVGNACLLAYSLMESDVVFSSIAAVILTIVFLEMVYTLSIRKVNRRKNASARKALGG